VDKLLSGDQLQRGGETSPESDHEESDTETETTRRPAALPPLLSPGDSTPGVLHPLISTSPLASPATNTLQHVSYSNPQMTHATTLPADSWRLLDIYSAYTQSWLPICEKHDLMRVSYAYPEAGLVLSNRPDSGDHAELWSALAVGAHQVRLDIVGKEDSPNVESMVETARGLIPRESGSFGIGHVKALLNLALIPIGQGKLDVAWLLVGSASKLTTLLQRGQQVHSPRWRHIVAGCFLIESLLAICLQGRPCLRRADFAALEEDGLEEWQPWAGPLASLPVAPPSRTPVLSLSSFNQFLNLTDILASTTANSESSAQPSFRLSSWVASLPAKFDYLIDKRKATPLNPPALMLQSMHICTQFVLVPSSVHVSSLVNLLERSRRQLGIAALPPLILCVLEHVQMDLAYNTVEQYVQVRMREIVADIKRAWITASLASPAGAHRNAHAQATPSSGVVQSRFPDRAQMSAPAITAPRDGLSIRHHRATTSLLEDLLPDMNPATPSIHLQAAPQTFGLAPLDTANQPPSLNPSNMTVSPDLETFFDELASLDGTEKMDNQPQFMQNLGFAPDASMADFLARDFTLPNTFTPHYDNDPVNGAAYNAT
jgi:hypothetical protein